MKHDKQIKMHSQKKLLLFVPAIIVSAFLFTHNSYAATPFSFTQSTTTSDWISANDGGGYSLGQYAFSQSFGTPTQYGTGNQILSTIKSAKISASTNGTGVSLIGITLLGSTCGYTSTEEITISNETASSTYTVNFSSPLNLTTCTSDLSIYITYLAGAPFRIFGSDNVYNPPDGFAGSTSSTSIREMFLQLLDEESPTGTISWQQPNPTINPITNNIDFDNWIIHYKQDLATTSKMTAVIDYGPTQSFGYQDTYTDNGIYSSWRYFYIPYTATLDPGQYYAQARIKENNLWIATSSIILFQISNNASSTFIDSLVNYYATSVPTQENSCEDSTNTFQKAICNSFRILFFPSTKIYEKFRAIPDIMYDKFPFSLITDGMLVFKELTATNTEASTSLEANLTTNGYSYQNATTVNLNFFDTISISQVPIIQTLKYWFTYLLIISWVITVIYAAIKII